MNINEMVNKARIKMNQQSIISIFRRKAKNNLGPFKRAPTAFSDHSITI
jgi:hypothetical protein